MVQQGADVDLIIELRRPSECAQRVIETPRGMVLQVDFPKVPGDDTLAVPMERERAKRSNETKTLGNDSAVHNDE